MIRPRIARALGVEPEDAAQLYGHLYSSASVWSASYVLDLIFSASIATLGMVLNSPTVVIGAMLLSPLMGLILAAGLAFAASDIFLGVRAFYGLVLSIIGTVLISAVLVWVLPFQSPTQEVLSQTRPNLLDLGVALLSAMAASVVAARSPSGGASALPSVALAASFMPPLCALGFGIGSGWNGAIISGAALLFLTNLVASAGAAFLVFYVVGMDAPEARAGISQSAMREAAGDRIYRLLHDTALGRVLGDVGQLRWRIAMVAVTLGALFVPLRSSLMQLKDESVCRLAAWEVVRQLVPADHLLSQRLEILPERVMVQLVTTTPVKAAAIQAAEAELGRRAGKVSAVRVRQVANEEEIIMLRESLRATAPAAPAAPPVPTLQTLRTSVRPLVEGPLKAVWPAESAELMGYEVGFGAEGPLVRLAYRSPKALDGAAQEAIRNTLRQGVGVEDLAAVFEWRGPAPKNGARPAQ